MTTAIEDVLNAVIERLVEEYEPEQIILYGSYAYGVPHKWSDLDLFIVKATQGSYFDRTAAVRKVLEGLPRHPRVEPWVYTPAEVARRLSIGDHFIETILDRGNVLYGEATYVRPLRTKKMDIVYAREWLAIAEQDYHRLIRNLGEEDLLAAYLLEQTVEKFLKAYLISKGWRLEKTHLLRSLVEQAARFDPPLDKYRSVCETIVNFYLADRYPTEPGKPDPLGGLPLTLEWIQEAYRDVHGLIDFIRQEVSEPRQDDRELPETD